MFGAYLRSTGRWITIEEEILDPELKKITLEEEVAH